MHFYYGRKEIGISVEEQIMNEDQSAIEKISDNLIIQEDEIDKVVIMKLKKDGELYIESNHVLDYEIIGLMEWAKDSLLHDETELY